MSDDETHETLSARDDDAEREDQKGSGSDSDDDSSSSSSGSSSESDSDSDSDKEGDKDSTKPARTPDDRKYSSESLGSNGLARREDKAAVVSAEPINVNSTLAAARFREQASTEPGLMALGTKKRDRRTIEEIQRDMKKRRPAAATPSSSSTVGSSTMKKPLGMNTGTTPAVVRASPPKSSPVMSPDSGNELERMNLSMVGKTSGVKPKVNSARSRLEKKLLGRGGGASTAARTTAPAKKSTSQPTPGTGFVTKMVRSGGTQSGSGSDHDTSMEAKTMEPKIEPRVVDTSKPDGRIVRSVLRGMLRFGDLTDVNLFSGDHHKSFADEYKLPNFVERAALATTCKMSEERLLKLSCDIAEAVQRVLEDNKDTLKFGDVEMKPSQIIERLYENLKLRVAVQRALYDHGAPANKGASAAYVLVSKQLDASALGVSRDFPAWGWAEREHDWNSKKDAALLIGIYIHGFGSWEDILNDDRLMMQQQRALKGERLKKRAENLLKRVPPPLSGSAAEPRIIQIATTMLNGAQNPGQTLEAQISAIVNGASVKGGRMQRAAERLAARSHGGGSESGRDEIPHDSIRKSHTQSANGRDRERSRERENSRERSRERERDRSRDQDRERERDRGRDHERDRPSSSRRPSISPPPTAAPSRSPQPESEPGRREHSSSSKSSSKRSASDDSTSNGGKSSSGRGEGSHSPRKKSKRREGEDASSRTSSSSKSTEKKPSSKRRLSADSFIEKWQPDQRLREVRQVLKKVKIMGDWSKTQSDVVVVEKMLEYVATIGEHIDKAVVESEKNGEVKDTQRDQFCTAMWTYAANFTPFPPVTFERLYDDICADGERLHGGPKHRQATATSS